MNQFTQESHLAVPEEVERFAREQGAADCLPAVLELGRRLFPTAALRLCVEADLEIPDDRHIVLLAEGAALSVAEALAAYDDFHRGLFASCPAPSVCVFRLGLEPVQ